MSKQDQDARMHSYAEQNAQLDLMHDWMFHIVPLFVPLIYYVWYRCHLVPSAIACVRILIPTHPPCMISQMHSQKKNVFFIVSRGEQYCAHSYRVAWRNATPVLYTIYELLRQKCRRAVHFRNDTFVFVLLAWLYWIANLCTWTLTQLPLPTRVLGGFWVILVGARL